MANLDLSLKTTALLVMDCQNGVLVTLQPADRDRVLRNVGRALQAARKAGIFIGYVVVQFRDSYIEISPKNKNFSNIKANGRFRQSQPDSAIAQELAPLAGEPIVVKKRTGAFTGSDLEVLLRSNGIDTLVLAGVSTVGVIESTARAAFDMDYRLFVLGDCCSDRDPEVHEAAMKYVLPRISSIVTVEDFTESLSARPSH